MGRHAAGALAGQPQRGRLGYHARLAWRWQAADGAGDASTDPGDNRCLYPLILNSGRIRDQWHTMTRTGAVPRLMQHIAEPMVEVAPQDAVRYQLPADGLARIWSRHGVMVAKVAISEGQRPGSLFVPMHWNNQFARQGRVNNLLAAVTDPYSGQPESKQAAVAIAAWQPAWHSELLPRTATISCGLALAAAGGARRAALLAGRGGICPTVAQRVVRPARLAVTGG